MLGDQRNADRRLSCTACGDVIGVYEPIWIEQPDGTRRLGSSLTLDHTSRDDGIRIRHANCSTNPPETTDGAASA